MKTTKIVIKNLFGIKETELDGRSVEISGPKGSGKTSVLDSIRYALTNRSDRDYIVHRGADEGEILIETDTGLSIDRKALPAKSAGTVKVRDGSLLQTRPAEFLSQIFTPLQLNPVEFTQLSRQEKNRVILNLIEFAWDTNWIREQFGEIPQGVDYSKHILEVLHDIQAENGVYFQSRQNINRDIRNKQAFVSDIAKDIPSGYDFDHWNTYPIGEKYRELESLKEQNNVIERARAFRNSHEAKLRGLEGQRDLDIAAIDRKTSEDRTRLTTDIERLKAEIRLYEERLAGLDERREESVRVVISGFNEKKAKLERDAGIADQYTGRELADTTALSKEIDTAEAMRKHLNEYQRMVSMQEEISKLTEESEELTRKIELARELPATILQTATIPVDGLTVEDGVPLIHGLPISNLSDGELKVKMRPSSPYCNDNFIPKHRLLWEAENGPVPKGHKLIFADGDKTNISLDNLLLITDAQMARLNKSGFVKVDKDLTVASLLVCDVISKTARRKEEMTRGKKHEKNC